jgi:hypothetical protein
VFEREESPKEEAPPKENPSFFIDKKDSILTVENTNLLKF